MPLTPFQAGVARALSRGRSEDSFLAGGAAIHLEPNSLRFSNDLDYFNDSAERVALAFEADELFLKQVGYEVSVMIERPGFVRAIVSTTKGKTKESTKVEWVHDSAWRFFPAVVDDRVGYLLHPIDLAINKLLALVGRDEPRDLLDTLFVQERTLCLGAMVWAATGKDPGFTPATILSMLRRRGRIHPEDLERLVLTEVPDLTTIKQSWLDALQQAEAFIASRVPEELGCLYYSPSLPGFPHDPSLVADVVPHYGRPGGVLPTVC